MRNHQITKTCFRTCSTCQSRSQAPLCLCTLRLVANQPEGTIARLRYLLGSRYAIRAGRNLPDKEFRYLRTVIVTAAVYRGFGSLLRPKANSSP